MTLTGVVISFGGTVMTTTLPPPKYDHPYNGSLVVHTLSESEAVARCGEIACATPPWHGHPCVITLPRNHPALALLRRHEIAHCNGWGGDHAGARTVEVPQRR